MCVAELGSFAVSREALAMGLGWKNWAGGVKNAPQEIITPHSAAELAAAVQGSNHKLRPVGSGHSFSPVCRTDDAMVDVRHLAGVLATNGAEVTVGAGTQLRQLTAALAGLGLGLHNQGDIDYQTVAGAISTSTHGTGLALGSVATAVTGITFCTPQGELITWRRDRDPEFLAGCVAMGLLGILTEVSIGCVPAYQLEETTKIAELKTSLAGFDANAQASRHFELFIFPQANRALEKTLKATNTPGGVTKHNGGLLDDIMLWGSCALGYLWAAGSASMQRTLLKVVDGDSRHGPSHLIFPSDRRVKFEELEYAVPAADGLACVEEVVHCLQTQFPEIAFPIELRTVAGDDLWMSPFFGGPRMTISVHERPQGRHKELFAAVEPIFRKYKARPHWGKHHSMGRNELRELYPKFDDFAKLRASIDPKGRMLSPYFASWFGAA